MRVASSTATRSQSPDRSANERATRTDLRQPEEPAGYELDAPNDRAGEEPPAVGAVMVGSGSASGGETSHRISARIEYALDEFVTV